MAAPRACSTALTDTVGRRCQLQPDDPLFDLARDREVVHLILAEVIGVREQERAETLQDRRQRNEDRGESDRLAPRLEPSPADSAQMWTQSWNSDCVCQLSFHDTARGLTQ